MPAPTPTALDRRATQYLAHPAITPTYPGLPAGPDTARRVAGGYSRGFNGGLDRATLRSIARIELSTTNPED